MTPKILILSASFGDGHNSAARNLVQALSKQAEVLMADPCKIGNPLINRLLCRAYREVTTYTPRIWAWVYRSTDQQDFNAPLPFIGQTEDTVGSLLHEFRPDLIVTTYPLYPYMVERHFTSYPRTPIITVITDSIEINAAWSHSPSDHFLVTDHHTKEGLLLQKIPARQIHITGFPVSPRFEHLPKIPATATLKPFHILFFPTARSPHLSKIIHAILSHEVQVTIVLGRNLRRLYKKTHALKKLFPGRIKIKGWTQNIPELLSSHHLVIGKAGGATVHEAIAAQCPMLVHHIIPGQEEGNIELLERYKSGSLATTPEMIQRSIGALLENDGQLWREQKSRLATHAKPAAARHAAELILSKTSHP